VAPQLLLPLRDGTVTLLLTCATREYVIQASDRRVCFTDGKLGDDDRGKAIFYCGRIAVAYTGVADIGGDTALWLARQLSKAPDIEAGLDSIGVATEMYFKEKGLRIQHTVVATGWATRQGTPPKGMPFIAASSNTYSGSLDEFKTRVNFVKPGVACLGYDFGQPLTPAEKGTLDITVRSGLKFKTAPGSIARALADQIRLVASGSDVRAPWVSKAVLVQCLSRSAIATGQTLASGLVSGIGPDLNGCVYLAEDGSLDEWKTPWIACGGAVLSGGGRSITPGGPSIFRSGA
jgi:hypothetical protein